MTAEHEQRRTLTMAKEATPRADALRRAREEQYAELQKKNGQVATGRESTLEELEAVADRNRQAWIEFGTALAEIRDRELYKKRGHGSFWAYAEVRFKISRSHAYRLMEEAETILAIEAAAENLPDTNLSRARDISGRARQELIPLAKDDPEAAAQVLAEVGRTPTAKEVREAVRQLKADFNAEYNIPPVERRSKPAEAKSQAPVFDEGVAAQVWDKIVADSGPEPTIEQIRQGMERYRPMSVLEGQQRTACVECEDFLEVHVTGYIDATGQHGPGPCTRLRIVDGDDGQTRPERCLCARYVAPEVEEVTIGGDIVVYSTKFLGMVRALHLELNKPESKMGLAQVASNPTLAREAGEQLDALALLLRRAQAMLMEPVEA